MPGRPDRVDCLPDGSWSRPLPECVGVNCGRPPLVDFGLVEVEVGARIRYCRLENVQERINSPCMKLHLGGSIHDYDS